MAVLFTDLPDSVLLEILSYLNCVELYYLSFLHTRLEQLTGDKVLWKRINFGPSPLTPQFTRKFVKYLGRHTKSVSITGFVKSTCVKNCPKKSHCLSDAFLLSLKRRCPNLRELNLYRCYIDTSNTNLSSLPTSLIKLSLSGSALVNLPTIRSRLNSPFFKIGKFFPNLEWLDIGNCDSWLRPVDVIVVTRSKTSLKMIVNGKNCFTREDKEKNCWTVQSLNSV